MRATLLKTCEETRREVGPFDRAARARCCYPGCRDWATWRPVLLLVPSREYAGKALRLRLSAVVCGRHRNLRVEHFVTDDMWTQLCADLGARGQAEPYRPGTRLDYEQQGVGA